MNRSVSRELVFLAILCAIAFVVGDFLGFPFEAVFIALTLYIIRSLINLNHLTNWLVNPAKNVPESTGVWEEVYYQLYQLYKRQRKSRKKLRKILSRFQKSTQALPYATIVLNENFMIEWFNPAAKLFFGLKTRSDIGNRVDNLIREPEFTSYLSRKDFVEPLELDYANYKILITVTPYGGGLYLLIARDETQAFQIDSMRRNFIANASHELKTPLTVISGYIESILNRVPEEFRLPVEKIQIQSDRMKTIIEELLVLAKLESSETNRYPETIEIGELLDDIYTDVLALDQNAHHIEVSVEPGGFPGSRDELHMAFSNLLTNALRYTPEGGRVDVSWTVDEAGGHLSVSDNGIGIDSEHIPHLTERFYRVDPGRSREKGGTGLGLAIVKHVLERHQATLYIQSAPGKGSLFRCDFPHLARISD